MGDLVPIRRDPVKKRLPTPFLSFVIRAFYQRLCQAGKAKKLALTACMRKLLTILNAMLKHGTPWRVTGESARLTFKTVADPF